MKFARFSSSVISCRVLRSRLAGRPRYRPSSAGQHPARRRLPCHAAPSAAAPAGDDLHRVRAFRFKTCIAMGRRQGDDCTIRDIVVRQKQTSNILRAGFKGSTGDQPTDIKDGCKCTAYMQHCVRTGVVEKSRRKGFATPVGASSAGFEGAWLTLRSLLQMRLRSLLVGPP